MIAQFKNVKKWQQVVLYALLCLPVLFAFNPVGLYFLNDDFIHIPLSQAAKWGQRNSIRPVGDFSLYIDSLLSGNNPVGYHITNLAIHIINSVLVYFLSLQLLRQLGVKENFGTFAAAAALLFFGYAFHAESVFWIIGRSASLSSLFFLLSLIIFLSNRGSWTTIILLLVLFFAALLTYESVWVLPVFVIAIMWRQKQFRSLKTILLLAGYVVTFLYYLFLRSKWTGELAGSYESIHLQNFDVRILAENFFKLLARTFVGPQQNGLIFIFSFVAFLAVAAIVFWRGFKTRSYPNSSFLWVVLWVISYLPYLSLGIDTHGVESERYLYLPSIFSAILIVALLANMRSAKWSVILFGLYLGYHLYFLTREARAFAVASHLGRTTMEAVRANQHKQFYYFDQLPQENYGVPVFRLGLKEGIEWLADKDGLSKIRVMNVANSEKNVFSKQAICTRAQNQTINISSYMVPSGGATDKYHLQTSGAMITKNDLLIRYSDSTVTIYR
jgi:hypothetical protein